MCKYLLLRKVICWIVFILRSCPIPNIYNFNWNWNVYESALQTECWIDSIEDWTINICFCGILFLTCFAFCKQNACFYWNEHRASATNGIISWIVNVLRIYFNARPYFRFLNINRQMNILCTKSRWFYFCFICFWPLAINKWPTFDSIVHRTTSDAVVYTVGADGLSTMRITVAHYKMTCLRFVFWIACVCVCVCAHLFIVMMLF